MQSTDIRHPIGIEVVYDVLRLGKALSPKIEIRNEHGIHLFSTHDVGEEWRYASREIGRYTSTAWVSGNFFAAGNLRVSVGIVSHISATALHAFASNAVTLQVIDKHFIDSAGGDRVGPISRVIGLCSTGKPNFRTQKRMFQAIETDLDWFVAEEPSVERCDGKKAVSGDTFI